jgi:hypothetical protein
LSLDDYLSLLKIALSSVGPDHKLAIFGSGRLSVTAFKELSSPPPDMSSEVDISLAVHYMETCKFSQKFTAKNVENQIQDVTWRNYVSFFEPSASAFYLKLKKGGKRVDLSSFIVPKILNFWPKFADVFDKLALLEDDWMV